MEVEYLYEFTVIAKLESFSRAAEELCISQSSLSKHILTLERELGLPLLHRNPRNVTLTPAGAEILPLAQQIATLNNAIRAAAEARDEKEKRTLSLASFPVMAQYGITDMLAKFRRECPKVHLEVTECERQEIYDLLDSGKCELAFMRRGLEGTEEGDLEYLELFRDQLVAVVSRAHPLSHKDQVSIQELRDEPLLFLDQQTGFHHLYISLCRTAGFVPHIAYTGLRPENLLAMAEQNMGIALVMRGHASYVDRPDVKVLELLPVNERPVCLAWRRDRSHTALAKEFWNFIQTCSCLDAPMA